METVALGFVFGAILQYARLNRFDTIAGMATLRNFTVAKTISFTIGLGVLLLQAEIFLGWGDYHIKPLLLTGIVAGGMLFGMGMAILGYCPGTVAISLGQGNLDALVGIIGGLFGSLAFALAYPVLQPLLGPNLGSVSLRSASSGDGFFWGASLVAALLFMGIALALQKWRDDGWKWLYAAVGMALLNAVLNLPAVAGHPMGASTAFPLVAMSLTGMGAHAYWEKIAGPGAWELWFLVGAFLAGLVTALVRGEFRITSVPALWQQYHGAASGRRFFWAFAGGFLLLFGARTAGGCTSGHIVSGGMQLAASSLVFAVTVFAVFMLTGRLFYRPATTA